MSYDYINRAYGLDIPVGQLVQHTVTGRFGRIQPQSPEQRHYVHVLFHGDRHVSYCHPQELDYEIGLALLDDAEPVL